MDLTLFVTCLGDTFYPGAVRSALNVLRRLGFKVAVPHDQTCCGQPMFNAGYFDQARVVARRFLDVFVTTAGPIVTPSSSCAAMIREHYPRLFRDDPGNLERARSVGSRTYEFSQFLVQRIGVNLAALGARFEGSATFHRSCHFRPLGVVDEPVDLIRQIDGLDYRPLERMEQCCGFGGTFAVNFPHVSERMTEDKLACIERTGADRLIFADAGCAMNLTGYASRVGRPLEAMHIAELIDRSLGGGP
jgi:L-lactate dehydrogenase complex protein LldE